MGFPTGSYAEKGPSTSAWKSTEAGVTNIPWAIERPEQSYNLGIFPTFSVIASSFSTEIAKEYDRVLANDAILGYKPMMWLPGAIIRRTPYAPAERVSYLGVVSIVIYIAATLISALGAFFKFSKKA